MHISLHKQTVLTAFYLTYKTFYWQNSKNTECCCSPHHQDKKTEQHYTCIVSTTLVAHAVSRQVQDPLASSQHLTPPCTRIPDYLVYNLPAHKDLTFFRGQLANCSQESKHPHMETMPSPVLVLNCGTHYHRPCAQRNKKPLLKIGWKLYFLVRPFLMLAVSIDLPW